MMKVRASVVKVSVSQPEKNMGQVLNATDFEAARAIGAAKMCELGFVDVCMAPGNQAKGHSHTLVEEILIIQKGTGKIQIEDTEFDLCAGSVAVVPAGQFHAVCNTGAENLEGVTIFNSNFDRDKVVLKSRKQHFGKSKGPKSGDIVEALEKENKKLKKRLKKLAKG
ncbi:MAG: mannose-6-phosphate isomerase-like protein (cupin superfamily) [Limisphaerales bacterium]|jgi:mannose-6-phosphate isomerase-like protein (cupin superfamily)